MQTAHKVTQEVAQVHAAISVASVALKLLHVLVQLQWLDK